MSSVDDLPPCVLHEDEHLLVVNKPAGMNTHSPDPYAGEGLYDWLKHREPRWASLAIVHRLDKSTSGVLVFGKTPLANRSLTEQFTARVIRKKYVLLTDREVAPGEFVVKSNIARAGDRYASAREGDAAETWFARAPAGPRMRGGAGPALIEAEPRTGRTHQIRVHAAESGFPILGDTLYGGTTWPRVCLHAAELTLWHPASSEPMTFRAPADFGADPRLHLRTALIDPAVTSAFRVIHGASDGWPGLYVDRLGEYLLAQSAGELSPSELAMLRAVPGVTGIYHKVLDRQVRRTPAADASPRLVAGQAAPERFAIRENGLQFELGFGEGYSVGLFLDQRDNRRRLETGHIGADFDVAMAGAEVLNTFAYTCGFAVSAAWAGARTTSLDLSKKYLEWGRRNFRLKGLDPAGQDFIYGDAFDWLRRFARKGRRFDVVVLDPPTFSQSKQRGVFRAEQDYGELIVLALPVLKPGGVLLASTNAAGWPAAEFVSQVRNTVDAAGRSVQQWHYVPQPADFPISRAEPAYLKTLWLRID